MRWMSIISLLAGALALVLGLGSMLAVISLLVGYPSGPRFLFETVTYNVPFPGSARRLPGIRQVTDTLKVIKVIPSMSVIGLLVVGASSGGLGIALALRRGNRGAARVAQAGLLSNVAGILLWLLAIMLTDWTQYN
jgi:hypothetical protein